MPGYFAAQAVASIAVLLLASGICVVLRRSSAAHRHLVWVLAFTALLVTPVCSWVIAPMLVRVTPSRVTPVVTMIAAQTDVPTQSPSRPASPPAIPLAMVAGAIWAAGTVVFLVRIWIGLTVCVRRRKESAVDEGAGMISRDLSDRLQLRKPASVFLSDVISVPETFGLWKPAVVLPSTARQWPRERLRIVLLHELIHVQRRDWAAHLFARISTAMFWFNPLSWYALGRLQQEREAACDDEVLRFGVGHSEYALELVAVARECRAASSSAMAVAMARTAHLQGRIQAILNPDLNRRRLTMKSKIGTLVPAALLVAVASMFTAPAQTGSATVSGIVQDPSGARIPEAQAILSKGNAVETIRTDAQGGFTFSGIPNGPIL